MGLVRTGASLILLVLPPTGAAATPAPLSAAAFPPAVSPAPAGSAAPAPEVEAYQAALDDARAAWTEFRSALDRLDEDLARLREDAREAARVGTTDDVRQSALDDGLYGPWEILTQARAAAAEAATFGEFLRLADPSLLARVRSKVAALADSATAARGVEAFRNLDESRRGFPREPLCAEGDAWSSARRGFLNAAVGDPGVDDCRGFRQSDAYPDVRGVTWESPTHAFFFDPGSGAAVLLPREAAARAAVWPRLLDPPPALDPSRLAWLASRFQPEALERGRARREQVRAWADPAHPAHPLFGLLGLAPEVNSLATLPDETFLARHAAQEGFAARVDSLERAERAHGFIAGTVRDALGGEPLSGARVIFSVGDRSDTVTTDDGGVYGLTFAADAGRVYRVAVACRGFQTLLTAARFPGRFLAGHDLVLNPEPRPFSIAGRVLDMTPTGSIPVSGATVAARSERGTAARSVTGADGAYRLTLLIPRDGEVDVRAERDDRIARARLTALGRERTGVDLRLKPISAAGHDEVVEIPPAPEAAPESPRDLAETLGTVSEAADPSSTRAPVPATPSVPPARATVYAPPPLDACAFVPEGAPFTQSSGQGGCAAATLSLELDALTFPRAIRPGETYTVEVAVRYDAGSAAADTAHVLVKAFFFDATPQRREMVFTESRVHMVSFTFDTDEMDLGHPSGRVGVGAGSVFGCERGDPVERVVTALQSYRREDEVPPGDEDPER